MCSNLAYISLGKKHHAKKISLRYIAHIGVMYCPGFQTMHFIKFQKNLQ